MYMVTNCIKIVGANNNSDVPIRMSGPNIKSNYKKLACKL